MPVDTHLQLQLTETARSIRRLIITMLARSGSGHPGGALGMADVFATLYGKVLKHRSQDPTWPERDYLFLSNGHICPVLYATLAVHGYFPQKELMTLRTFKSPLQGHPHLGSLPGIENTSGPLGQGLSQACGVATAFKMDNKPNRIFCVMSDGEQQEGQTWEAYLYAAKYHLSNLTVLLDRNNIQIDGFTDNVMPLAPLNEKIASFGWNVIDVDGHSFEEILAALQDQENTQPTALICHTVPGKGVSFMENKPEWHGRPPTALEAEQALRELGI